MKTTLLRLSANQPIPSGGSGAVISWSTAVNDDVGAFNLAQPTRITVPVGVSRVRFTASAVFATNANGLRQVYSRKDGALYPVGYLSATALPVGSGSSTSMSIVGPWVSAAPGDYWELFAYQTSGATLAFGVSDASWFQAEWF